MKVVIFIVAFLAIYVGITAVSNNDSRMNMNDVITIEETEWIKSISEEGIESNQYVEAFIEQVATSEYIVARYNNDRFNISLIGAEMPKVPFLNASGEEVEVYSQRSLDFVEALILRRNVKLVFENKVKEDNGNLLVHIVLSDGTYLNGTMIRNGYAMFKQEEENNNLEEYLRELEELAKEEELGMWLEEDE